MKIDKNVVEEDYFDVNLPGHVIEEKNTPVSPIKIFIILLFFMANEPFSKHLINCHVMGALNN